MDIRRNFSDYEVVVKGKNGELHDLAGVDVNSGDKILQFSIRNKQNTGLVLKGGEFSITDEVLVQSIAKFKKDFGEATKFLNGHLAEQNLSYFQIEFVKIRRTNQRHSPIEVAN